MRPRRSSTLWCSITLTRIPGRACSGVILDTRPPLFAALQSGHSLMTALQRLCSSSLLLLLGEGLAQLLLLLLWQVGRDDLEVVGLQLVYDPLRGVGPAGQRKQRGGARRHLLTHLPDEVVVYPNVGQRSR